MKPVEPSEVEHVLGGRTAHLVETVQKLSLARDLDTVTAIVRRAARELSGSDGATFVLRDGDKCFYADEDAIAPLWKGHRFPLEACISGWAMLNKQVVEIEDIYQDPRIPIEAYRPTFVKSLVMVPIRTAQPIGAIGHYWATHHRPTSEDITLLQALADSTSIAIENVQLYADLENRVRQRTEELEAANAELEAFSYSVTHDLRNPLRAICRFTEALAEDYGMQLDDTARGYLTRVASAGARMGQLIDDLLALARVGKQQFELQRIDLSAMVRAVSNELVEREPSYRRVRFEIEDGMRVTGDLRLLTCAFENLLSNACKFSARAETPVVEIRREAGDVAVRDNGAGFDPALAPRLFKPFSRLHTDDEFAGTGVGLATVARIMQRHGGAITAQGAVGNGATFTLSFVE